MTIEEFRQLQAEMPDEELVKIATEELSKMCHTGGNSFHMSVPVKTTDTDMIFSQLLVRFKASKNIT